MSEPSTTEPDSADDCTRIATVLVGNYLAFLRFLERRVGDRALAEDLLQEAFTCNLDRLKAGVQLFRAREALRRQVAASYGASAEHGCVDCCAAGARKIGRVMKRRPLRLGM